MDDRLSEIRARWAALDRAEQHTATHLFSDLSHRALATAQDEVWRNARADLAYAVAEIERLLAALTITDAKVDAAAELLYRCDWENGERFEGEWRDRYLRNARAALLAAGMEEQGNV